MTEQQTTATTTRPKKVPWLYTGHFGLNKPPFTLTPDTRFFYMHDSCQDALNTLTVALRSGEGFIKVTGEVGTGKTVLCRKLLSTLRSQFIVAYLPNPYLEPMTLLFAIADELGIPYNDNTNQHQLLKSLMLFFIDSCAKKRRTIVLCMDEAHAMPLETMEALRLLSNLETQQRKLLQLVLFGQPELDEKLANPRIRQLRQRISFSCELQPLQQKDVADYLAHRLNIAGFNGDLPFTDKAIKHMYRASGGVLRLLNILAHKSMMAAYGEGKQTIRTKHVLLAIDDTESIELSRRSGWLLKALSFSLTNNRQRHYQHGQSRGRA